MSPPGFFEAEKQEVEGVGQASEAYLLSKTTIVPIGW